MFYYPDACLYDNYATLLIYTDSHLFTVTVLTLHPRSPFAPSLPRYSPPSMFSEPSDLSLPPLPPPLQRCDTTCSRAECLDNFGYSPPSDANGDCVFDLVDSLFICETAPQTTLLELELLPDQLEALDADRNGVINFADAEFLANARMGNFPLISDLELRPIESEFSDCRLSINFTLRFWNGDIPEESDTFVHFGLFHSDSTFQFQYDSTPLSIGSKNAAIALPAGATGGWIDPEYFGDGVYGIQTEPGIIAQTNIGFIPVYGTFDPQGAATPERTLLYSGFPRAPLAYTSLDASFEGVSLSLPSFNPQQFFNNNFPADLCYNRFAPVINPNLGNPIIITQPENVPVNDTLRIITATDADAPRPAGDIAFSLTDVRPEGVIDIFPGSGVIYVATPLDIEVSGEIRATIIATDQGPHVFTRLTDSLTLIINLVDVNDNPPLADEPSYSIGVVESVPVPINGTSQAVFTFTGGDTDVEADNRGFSVVQVSSGSDVVSPVFTAVAVETASTESGSRFSVSLHLLQELDREAQDFYNLTVLLIDNGSPPQQSIVEIDVNVVDANDIRPVFLSSDRANLTENNEVGAFIIQVVAVDFDLGSNAQFTFEITNVFVANDEGVLPVDAQPVSGLFVLDELTGAVTANTSFDREGDHSFIVNIIAVENAIAIIDSTVQSLWVMICDENDVTPSFNQSQNIIYVREDSRIGSAVSSLTAFDGDLGPFCPNDEANVAGNPLDYRITTLGVPFIIADITGDIIVAGPLDFEGIQEYSMVIVVEDNGTPPLSSSTNLTIFITDVNDNLPVLNGEEYFNIAVENNTVGSVVIDFISATDADSPPNDVIEYALFGPGSADFDIDNATGVITIAIMLDRETQRIYELSLIAFNPDMPSLNDTAPVLIEVQDINDNPPEFNQSSYTARVSENALPGSIALTVLAVDPDQGPNRNFTYSLYMPHPLFEIDLITGDIRTTQLLCTDSDIDYNFIVVATDHPGGELRFSSNATVTVTVVDDNSRDPEFTRTQYAAIVEDGAQPEVEIITVQATDEDVCSPPFNYSIKVSVGSNLFSIDNSTGVISIASVLTRADSEEYFLTVEAMDSGTPSPRTGSATVIVLVGESTPVELTTSAGFPVTNPQRVTNEPLNVYEQEFDFFYAANPLDLTASFSARFGDLVSEQDFVVSRLPASEVNALLLTPTVFYDQPMVQVAAAAVDEFGSSQVDQAEVFVTASTEIDGRIENVTSSGSTLALSSAIVELQLPREWFNGNGRMVTISYGIVGYPASTFSEIVSLVPLPNFNEACANETESDALIIMQVPAYSVYRNQMVSIPILAQLNEDTAASAIALECSVSPGMQFNQAAISTSPGWAASFQLNSQASVVTLTSSKLSETEAYDSFEEVLALNVDILPTSSLPTVLQVECQALQVVDVEGSFERYSAVLAVDRSGCQRGVGGVYVVEDILLGGLHHSVQTVLINDAILTGNTRQVFPTVVGVLLAAQPRFTNILSGGISSTDFTLSCSSADTAILQVSERCTSVFVSGSEATGAESIQITFNVSSAVTPEIQIDPSAFPLELTFQVWYPDTPVQLTLVDDSLSPINGSFESRDSSCVQAYQRTSVEALATFRCSPSDSVEVRVERILDLTSLNSNIAIVSGTEVIGISTGTAIITASRPAINNALAQVNSEPVNLVEFDVIFASQFSALPPEPIPFRNSDPFRAIVDSNLLYQNQDAHLVTTAIFSDGVRYQISDGLSYASLDETIIQVSGRELTALASGSGDLLATTLTGCDGDVVLSRDAALDIDLVVPEVEITISDTYLAHANDPAVAVGAVSSSASVTVELVYRYNGEVLERVDITSSPGTVFSFSLSGLLQIREDNGVQIVEPAITSVPAVVSLTASYLDTYESSVEINLGYSVLLSVGTTPYPTYQNSAEETFTVARPIGNTDFFQQAMVNALLTFQFPDSERQFDVTSNPSLIYGSVPSGVLSISDGILTPMMLNDGQITIQVRLLNLPTASTFRIIPNPVQIVSIDRLELTSGEAIVGLPGNVVARLSAAVTFSDGTRIEEVFTESGQIYTDLLSVSGSDSSIFTVDPSSGDVTIQGYSVRPASISVSGNDDNAASRSLEVYTNLESQSLEIDLGQLAGQPIAPVELEEEFEVPVHINFASQLVGAVEIGVAYSADIIELVSTSVGPNWPQNRFFESSEREFRGYVYFGGIWDVPNTESGLLHIATLTFRARGVSGTAAIRGDIMRILDQNTPAQGAFFNLSPAASIAVTVGGSTNEVAPIDVSALDALLPTVPRCFNPVLCTCSSGREIGDVNNDCIFDLADVLFFSRDETLRTGACLVEPNVDFNIDTSCNDQDLSFLLRAHFRIVQFVQSVEITPVNTTDCFLAIRATLTRRGNTIANGARTSLLIGLFHPDQSFQQQVDGTVISRGVGQTVATVGELPSSTNGGFFEAVEETEGSYRVVLNTQISATGVGLILLQARVDAFGQLTSVSRVQTMSGFPSIPVSYPETIDNATVLHPNGLPIPFDYQLGFSHLLSFDQTFSSPDCINFNVPVFFPEVRFATVYENLEVGSVVATVFANDSDAGPNAEVIYSFFDATSEQLSTFEINATSGEVYLISSLDRESIDQYFIGLRALDRGILETLGGFGELRITVLDVNDVEPEFNLDPYTPPSISEAVEVGTVVEVVSAVDEDLGENATVTYRLSEPNLQFSINATSGIITTTAPLDFEAQMRYDLVVVATDGGTPSLNGTTTVIVIVDPINDNVPECFPLERLALVPEDALEGQVFFLVNVSDADLGDLGHNVLNYSLNDNTVFDVEKINDNYAAIVPAAGGGFDRLSAPTYNITLLVADIDGFSCSVEITIIVAEQSRFNFQIQRPGPGFLSGPVNRAIDGLTYSQNISFFRDAYPTGAIGATLGTQGSTAMYNRGPNPIESAQAVLLTDELWFDNQVIRVAAIFRDASFSGSVEGAPVIEVVPMEGGEAVRGEPCDDLSFGQCVLSVNVPSEFFSNETEIVNVTLIAGSISVDVGTVTLNPIVPIEEVNTIALVLPGYSLLPNESFNIAVFVSERFQPIAFQFNLELISNVQIDSTSVGSDWNCQMDDDGNTLVTFLCLRDVNEEPDDFYLEIEASIFGEVNTQTIIAINGELLSLSGEYGPIVSSRTYLNFISTRYGLTTAPGFLTLDPVAIQGIYAISERSEIINTAQLDGFNVVVPIQPLAVYNDPNRIVGLIDTAEVECTLSASSSAQIDGDCRLILTPATVECGEITVTVTHTPTGFTFDLPLRVWCLNTTRMEVSDRVLNRVTDLDGNCLGPGYQTSQVQVFARFDSDNYVGPEVDVTEFVEDLITSDNAAVATDSTSTVRGVSPGMATISIPFLSVSATVEVTDDPVDVYSLNPTVFTSFEVEVEPTTYSPDSSIAAIASLEQEYDNVGLNIYTSAFVYYTDGARYDIADSIGLSAVSNSPEVVSVLSDGSLETQASGPADILLSWTPQNCQEVVSSASIVFEVEAPFPSRIELQSTSQQLAGDTQGVDINVPESSEITTLLYLSDDTFSPVQVSEFEYNSSELILVAGATTLSVTANLSTVVNESVLTVRYTAQNGAVFSASILLTILHVVDLDAGVQAYPNPTTTTMNTILLELLGDSGYRQQARIVTEAILSDSSTIEANNAVYSPQVTDRLDISSDGVVTPLPGVLGGTMVAVSAGLLTARGSNIVIDISAISIDVAEVLSIAVEDTGYIRADISFTDGTVLNDVLEFNSALSDLLTFSIDPPSVAEVNTTTWILTVIDNHYDLVTLTVASTADFSIANSLSFTANLEPAVGEVDLGRVEGAPQPPVEVGEEITVDVRINVDGASIAALDIVYSYNPDELQFDSIDVLLSGYSAIRKGAPLGEVQLAMVVNDPVTDLIPTVARLSFTALTDQLTTITASLNVLADDSLNTVGSGDAQSLTSTLNVLVTPPARRRRSAPLPSLKHFSSDHRQRRQVAPDDAVRVADVNGDGFFDVRDAAFIAQALVSDVVTATQSTLLDANKDSAITVADIIFLTRASVGLIPLLDAVAVTQVSQETNCTFSISTTLAFDSDAQSIEQTFVFFALSYPSGSDFIASSVTQSVVGTILDDTTVIFEALPAPNADNTYSLQMETPLDREFENVGLSIVTFTTTDDFTTSPDRFTSFISARNTFLVGSPGELIPQVGELNLTSQRNPSAAVTGSTIGEPNGFSPLQNFTNDIRSDYCEFEGRVIQLEVPENQPLNVVFATITAADPRYTSSGETYTIATPDLAAIFNLSSNGDLSLLSELDFETISMYTFEVNARASFGYDIGNAQVNIVVLDFNDFPPVFSTPEFSLEIVENDADIVNTLLVQFNATDQDEGINGEFSYMLDPSTDPNSQFTLDSTTGELFITEELDRENISSYTLIVYAIDQGIPQLNSSAIINITVLDLNDNAPEFDMPVYEVEVPEDFYNVSVGVSVIPDFQIIVTDPDFQENGTVTLELILVEAVVGIVQIDNNGFLSVNTSLDRERRDEYMYMVEARDGSINASANVVWLIVRIGDINDNAPLFRPDNDDFLFVEEDFNIGNVLTTLIATDADATSNGLIAYSIQEENIPFTINSATGELSVSEALDIDTAEYILNIVATDGGNPSLSAVWSLTLDIIEPQVISFDIPGSRGFVLGEPVRIGDRQYAQDVGYFFRADTGTSVDVTGSINTAVSGDLDQTEVPKVGDTATTITGSLLQSVVQHSVRTVTAFVQVYDDRSVIAEPTIIRVRVNPSLQLQELGSVEFIDETCTTSPEFGYCVVQVRLPDEWFMRASTNAENDNIVVWANRADSDSPGTMLGELVVEHSPVYNEDDFNFNFNRIALIPPSHSVFPGQLFAMEVFVASPLDLLYDSVQIDVVSDLSAVTNITFDSSVWDCSELTHTHCTLFTRVIVACTCLAFFCFRFGCCSC